MADRSEHRALRVAHVDHTTTTGGAEYALARLLRAEHDWSGALLLPPTTGENVYVGAVGAVPVQVAGVAQAAGASAGGAATMLTLGASLFAQAAVTRMSAAFRSADIVHANTARSSAYAAIAAWTSRTVFVVHLRDMINTEALGKAGFALMTRLVLPRADGVVANSRSTLESARAHLRPGTQAEVIPSASGLHRARPRVTARSPVRIGMLARIDPWKGQDLLIDAFAAAFPHGDETLELAGGAPFGHEDHLRALRHRAQELGIGHRVLFPGHVTDVDRRLETWDVAVQASVRAEPMGQNVLQYLAAGVPAVVADEGGPAEWVADGENGVHFRARDAESLARVLRALADDPAFRLQLSAAAVATEGLLTDADVAAAHAAFYRRVTGRPAAEKRR
jgi:glycosyltransferase involved in cell wall biosynthesis